MAQAILISNPFDPWRTLKRFDDVPAGITPLDWLRLHFGRQFEDFEVPTLCMVNGEPLFRSTMHLEQAGLTADQVAGFIDSYQIKPGDQLSFTTLPGDVTTIVMAIIAIILAVIAIVMMPDPIAPGDTAAAESANTLRGQTNRIRLGDPIECHYGKVRIWPTYAAPPYNIYQNNDNYQFSLFCIGWGEFQMNTLQIEDTPISNFEDVEWQLVPPGGAVTLFPDVVVTSIEIRNIELFGPNNPGHAWAGNSILNAPGTQIKRIEFDVVFPAGLYTLLSNVRYDKSVVFEFQGRTVDDDGAPIGAWTILTLETVMRRTATPQRITVGVDVTPGRYEVRVRRNTDTPTSSSTISKSILESVRGFGASQQSYPGVTMLAVNALATNSLNDQSKNRINGYFTRKLELWNTVLEEWTDPIETRNPVWAFCDVYRSHYGGKLETEYLDMATLAELAEVAEAREDWFDYTFDSQTTVWEAGQAVLRVVRSIPLPQASRMSARRDQMQTAVAALFTPANIVKGSFETTIHLFKFNPWDSLEIEYTDPVTWKPKTVTCVLPGGTNDNPERVRFPGITQRPQAFREGLYMLAARMKERQNVEFGTGLEGYIPTIMDKVAVAHDVIRSNGQAKAVGGFITAYDSGTRILTLSMAVEFGEGAHAVLLRNRYGAALGTAITATPGPQSNQVVLATEPVEAIPFIAGAEPPQFIFGAVARKVFEGKVVSLKPSGQEQIRINLVNYDETVYGYDDTPVPDDTTEDAGHVDPDPVDGIDIGTNEQDPSKVFITWRPVQYAVLYLVEQSDDEGATWNKIASTRNTYISVQVLPDVSKFRVRSVDGRIGRYGPYGYSQTFAVGSGEIPDAPVLDAVGTVDFTGDTFTVAWEAVAGATGYIVAIFRQGEVLSLRQADLDDLTLTYGYTITMMNADGIPERALEARVRAINASGSSVPLVIADTNPKPDALTGLAQAAAGGGDWDLEWDALPVTPDDFLEYRVYASTVAGFTPSGANLIYQGADPFTTIPVSTTTYWKAGAFDVWARGHTDANLSAQQTIVP